MKVGTAYFIYKDGAMRCREDFKSDGPCFYEVLEPPKWAGNSTPQVISTETQVPTSLEFPHRKFILGKTPPEVTATIFIYFEV